MDGINLHNLCLYLLHGKFQEIVCEVVCYMAVKLGTEESRNFSELKCECFARFVMFYR